jgi:hypothetical protein
MVAHPVRATAATATRSKVILRTIVSPFRYRVAGSQLSSHERLPQPQSLPWLAADGRHSPNNRHSWGCFEGHRRHARSLSPLRGVPRVGQYGRCWSGCSNGRIQ